MYRVSKRESDPKTQHWPHIDHFLLCKIAKSSSENTIKESANFEDVWKTVPGPEEDLLGWWAGY